MSALELVCAAPQVEPAARVLVFDGATRVLPLGELPSLVGPGDVVVLNDAATFPGSVHFQRRELRLEVRLFEKTPRGFKAVLFGPGDFHTRTEHRAPPPRMSEGERFTLAGLEVELVAVDARAPRLVELQFDADEATQWSAVYRHGHPVQYAHQREPLPLWAVQNVYAERPWAAELPSAGHHLSFSALAAMQRRGAVVARLTHATGLSSTGDEVLDASLPWPERYSIPESTLEAVAKARRVVAIGTSVLRALETHAQTGVREGIATEVIGPESRMQVVDALLTGIHSPQESHYRLLGALLEANSLARVTAVAAAAGLRSHEFGDVALLIRERGTGRR
jgi:S-adenosylmethionine:tRNA ribosyltransferase-isomerase